MVFILGIKEELLVKNCKFKTRKSLKERDRLLSIYPKLTNRIAGPINILELIPDNYDTENQNCSTFFSDAISAATVLYPFKEPTFVNVPSKTYLMGRKISNCCGYNKTRNSWWVRA